MNNRIISTLAAVLLLAIAPSAMAALDAIEGGYELGTNELTLPAHSAGQVVISGCEECESSLHPVNSQTLYFVGDTAVSLDDLRAAVTAEVGTFIHVAYSLDTGYVTRIRLSPNE